MSTADSQIFALSTEFEGGLPIRATRTLTRTKLLVLVFAILATTLALVSNDQLVMLARVSFAGTAMIAPMVLVAVLYRTHSGPEIPCAAAVALIVFLISTFGLLPSKVIGFRLELLVLLIVGTVTGLSVAIRRRVEVR